MKEKKSILVWIPCSNCNGIGDMDSPHIKGSKTECYMCRGMGKLPTFKKCD
jgi:DnaJ-class molecular chaperone